MGVSIWEGSKAQGLIDAINNANKVDREQGIANAGKSLVVGSDGLVTPANVGITDSIKSALMLCFENVAWESTDGSDYIEALRSALYEQTPVVEDWTWKYEASSGELLSNFEGISEATIPTGASETLVDGILRLTQQAIGTGVLSRFSLSNTTNTKAKLSAKVKFRSIPVAMSHTATWFRLQLSDGTSGVQVFERKDVNDGKYYLVAFEGTTGVTLTEIELDTWYILSVERTETEQKIYLDGRVIFESQQLSQNYCSSNRILFQSPGPDSIPAETNASIIDIEWIAYKNND